MRPDRVGAPRIGSSIFTVCAVLTAGWLTWSTTSAQSSREGEDRAAERLGQRPPERNGEGREGEGRREGDRPPFRGGPREGDRRGPGGGGGPGGRDGGGREQGAVYTKNTKSEVSITERDGYRYIVGNGIPDHTPGQFPNRRNPNTIREQKHTYRVPIKPKANSEATPMRMHPFGIALNGVPFDPGAAEFYNRDRSSGWQYEALGGVVDLGLDSSNAHVQPTGAYHYHGIPNGLVKEILRKRKTTREMIHVGWAADGYPIYVQFGYKDADDPKSGLTKLKPSYRVKKGSRPGGQGGGNNNPGGRYDGRFVQDWEYVKGAGDLDENNGRFGVTPEFPDGTYYYVLTDAFPYIPRQFKGTPDESFMRRGPGRGNGHGQGPGEGGRGPGGRGPEGRGPEGRGPGGRGPGEGRGPGGRPPFPPPPRGGRS